MLNNAVSRRGFLGLSASAAALAAAGCSSNGSSSTSEGSTAGSAEKSSKKKAVTLQVFAANSLEKALPEVQELYTKETGVEFADTQFKASGDLVQQMQGGADVDVLICASKSTMDDAGDLIDSDTREDMFTNDLVIIQKEGGDVQLSSIADVANVDSIAVGDAALVPAGKYANQALASAGLYTNSEGTDGEYADSIKDKVNSGADKVGTVAQYVASGTCTVGFVYSSDIFRYDGVETAFTCPEDSHKPIVYPGAVAADSANADEAKDFIDFCMSNKKAQKVWAKYGFELSA